MLQAERNVSGEGVADRRPVGDVVAEIGKNLTGSKRKEQRATTWAYKRWYVIQDREI